MNAIQELWTQRLIAPEDITIMIYYRAQDVYRNVLREYVQVNPEAARIENRTVDSIF